MINSATKQSILSWRGPMDCSACCRNDGVETRAPHLQPSSPGLTGRSSIPETAVMESQIPGLIRSLSSGALSCDPLVAIKIYRPCDFPEPIQQVCPTGKSLLIFRNRVKPRNQKYFASPLTQIRCISKPSWPDRGALRTSRNAGRDAVDAAASGEQ